MGDWQTSVSISAIAQQSTSLSIVGSKDNVINRKNYEKNKSKAPEDAIYKILEGGNHANYGDYGKQEGDGEATINREEQIKQTALWIEEFCQ